MDENTAENMGENSPVQGTDRFNQPQGYVPATPAPVLVNPEAGKSKGLIVSIVVAVLLLIGGGVAVYMILRPGGDGDESSKVSTESYKKAQEIAQKAIDEWNALADPLKEVRGMSEGKLEDVSLTRFVKYIEKSRTSISEFRAAVAELKEAAACKEDDEFKADCDALYESSEKWLGNTESKLKILLGVYGFGKTIEGMKADNYEKIIDEATGYLTETGDEKLEEFAKSFATLAKDLLGAAVRYSQSGKKADLDTYNKKEKEFKKAMEEFTDYGNELGKGKISDGQGEIVDGLNGLMDYVAGKTGEPTGDRATEIVESDDKESLTT